MKKELLTSFTPLDVDASTIKENRERNNGKIVLKGILQRADTLNQNGRIYPRDILAREVENYQKFIRERRALGEADHPASSVVNLQNVSHLVTEARWEDDAVVGTVELLNTPMGKLLQTLVEDGVKLGISSRGVGSTVKEGNNDVVQDDLILIAFDMVADPSTPNAFMLAEGRRLVDVPTLSRSDRIDRILTEILRDKR